ARLVQRVVDLLQVGARRHVERVLLCHSVHLMVEYEWPYRRWAAGHVPAAVHARPLCYYLACTANASHVGTMAGLLPSEVIVTTKVFLLSPASVAGKRAQL